MPWQPLLTRGLLTHSGTQSVPQARFVLFMKSLFAKITAWLAKVKATLITFGAFGVFAKRVYDVMEWPAVRLTAIAFAVVGDFEDAVYCWRTQAASWPDRNLGIVLAAGAGAMGVRLGMPISEANGLVEPRPELGMGESADVAFLDSTVGLLWRSLVVWVFLLGLLSVARIFS